MKTRLLVMVAVVAIFSLRVQTGNCQDASPVQQAILDKEAFDQRNQLEAQAQMKSSLSPEQTARMQEARKKILAQRPPIPTNPPAILKTGVKNYVEKDTTPPLTQGERMQLRNMIMTELLKGGDLNPEGADFMNEYINDLNNQGLPLESVIAEANAAKAVLNLTSSLMSFRTVDFESNIYSPINTGPFGANFSSGFWATYTSLPTGDYPWITTNRTLVTTNGPQAQTYPLGYGISGQCRLFATVVNHVDQGGYPVRHILAFWYTLVNLISGPDDANITIPVSTAGTGSTNLAYIPLAVNSPFWDRPAYIIPKAATNSIVQLRVTLYKTHYSTRPVASNPALRLDPSVQWIPYWLSPISGDLVVERVGNEMWVEWSTLAYQQPYFRLTYAINAKGPYTTLIGVPITITNEVAIAKFPIDYSSLNQRRFYKLQNF